MYLVFYYYVNLQMYFTFMLYKALEIFYLNLMFRLQQAPTKIYLYILSKIKLFIKNQY